MNTQLTVEPVVRTIEVSCSIEHAFRTFTERIGSWWPLASHSIGGVRAEHVELEAREGGLLVERYGDDERAVWGKVLAWEPPHRLLLSWHPGQDASLATEVEVTFGESPGGTRVTLEHRGWDRLGADAEAARLSYDEGWPIVLGGYERLLAA